MPHMTLNKTIHAAVETNDHTIFTPEDIMGLAREALQHRKFMRQHPIHASAIVGIIARMLRHPFAQVCRHHVASTLLDQLERHGAPVSPELASAVVNANDETALRLLPTLGIEFKSDVT